MVLVNLLPWRIQEQRYRRDCLRQSIIAAVVCAVLSLFIVHLCLQTLMKSLENHIAVLKQQLHQAELRYQEMNTTGLKQNSLRDVNTNQSNWEAIIRQIADVRLTDVCFTEISRYQDKIRFTGKASTADMFSAFFSMWPAVAHFDQIRVDQIKPDGSGLLAVEFEGVEKREYGQRN